MNKKILILVLIILILFITLCDKSSFGVMSVPSTTFYIGDSAINSNTFPSITSQIINIVDIGQDTYIGVLTNNSSSFVVGFPAEKGGGDDIEFIADKLYGGYSVRQKTINISNNIIVSCYDLKNRTQIKLTDNILGNLQIYSIETPATFLDVDTIDYTLSVKGNGKSFEFDEQENGKYAIIISLETVLPVTAWYPTVYLYSPTVVIPAACSDVKQVADCETVKNSNVIDQNNCQGCKIVLDLNGKVPPYDEAPELYIKCYDAGILNYTLIRDNRTVVKSINNNDLYLVTDFFDTDSITVVVQGGFSFSRIPVKYLRKISLPFVSNCILLEYNDPTKDPEVLLYDMINFKPIGKSIDDIYNAYSAKCNSYKKWCTQGVPNPVATTIIYLRTELDETRQKYINIIIDVSATYFQDPKNGYGYYGLLTYLQKILKGPYRPGYTPNSFDLTIKIKVEGSRLDTHEAILDNSTADNQRLKANILPNMYNNKTWSFDINYSKGCDGIVWHTGTSITFTFPSPTQQQFTFSAP